MDKRLIDFCPVSAIDLVKGFITSPILNQYWRENEGDITHEVTWPIMTGRWGWHNACGQKVNYKGNDETDQWQINKTLCMMYSSGTAQIIMSTQATSSGPYLA